MSSILGQLQKGLFVDHDVAPFAPEHIINPQIFVNARRWINAKGVVVDSHREAAVAHAAAQSIRNIHKLSFYSVVGTDNAQSVLMAVIVAVAVSVVVAVPIV